MTWQTIGFLAKVVVFSLAVAIALKTLAPRLSISETPGVAIAIVLTPALLMASFLSWQLWRAQDGNRPHSGHH